MKRWLPTPYMSLTILTFWLLLSSSVEPAQLLLGLLLAILLPIALRAFWPPAGRISNPGVIVLLVGRVLLDIVSPASILHAAYSAPSVTWNRDSSGCRLICRTRSRSKRSPASSR